MHDGTKIKACAGADSFRREERVAAHLEAARQQVRAMDDPRGNGRHASGSCGSVKAGWNKP